MKKERQDRLTEYDNQKRMIPQLASFVDIPNLPNFRYEK
jgi:hypothetical protein